MKGSGGEKDSRRHCHVKVFLFPLMLGGNAEVFPKVLSLHVPKGSTVADEY